MLDIAHQVDVLALVHRLPAAWADGGCGAARYQHGGPLLCDYLVIATRR